ncbi:hypothetical protein BDQ17DRAFT_1332786 [Cyathus striatus]|nr:hypothetical protein BDQ17DRAFT_1332786 [Cyathus striatus]
MSYFLIRMQDIIRIWVMDLFLLPTNLVDQKFHGISPIMGCCRHFTSPSPLFPHLTLPVLVSRIRDIKKFKFWSMWLTLNWATLGVNNTHKQQGWRQSIDENKVGNEGILLGNVEVLGDVDEQNVSNKTKRKLEAKNGTYLQTYQCGKHKHINVYSQ